MDQSRPAAAAARIARAPLIAIVGSDGSGKSTVSEAVLAVARRYELLRQKVSVTPRLRFGGARIVDLDSREPYGRVCAAVSQIVRATLGAAVAAH